MIKFHKIKFKNFLSYGNYWTEIDFLRPRFVLLTGKNGHGKSVILDALSYALYGHAFRDVKKAQVINSVNNKDCVVNLTLRIDEVDFEITRGQKPNIFEIKRDGEEISVEADVRETQLKLEQYIGMSFETFKQIVVLGSASYKPFMKLSASQRREVFEDILHLGIYSIMQNELKKKISISKEKKTLLLSNHRSMAEVVRVCENRLLEINKINEDISNRNNEIIDELKIQLENIKNNIADLQQKIKSYNIDELKNNISELESEILNKNTNINKIKHNIVSNELFLEKYIHEINCPTCGQKILIDEDEKNKNIKIKEDEIDNLRKEVIEYSNEKQNLVEKQEILSMDYRSVNNLIKEMADLFNEGKRIKEEIQKKDKLSIKIDSGEAQSDLDKNREVFLNNQKQLDKVVLQIDYFNELNKILSDTGVKQKIVKTYIPYVNSIIEKHLDDMGFNASFVLDETFNETVKSRYRDEFSYESFSEGQKLRIDLALLFAWREVASKKNSVSTNLILFDEILDRSLDYEGSIAVVDIIKKIVADDNQCCILISHNEKFQDQFDEKILVELKGNFSYQKEISI